MAPAGRGGRQPWAASRRYSSSPAHAVSPIALAGRFGGLVKGSSGSGRRRRTLLSSRTGAPPSGPPGRRGGTRGARVPAGLGDRARSRVGEAPGGRRLLRRPRPAPRQPSDSSEARPAEARPLRCPGVAARREQTPSQTGEPERGGLDATLVENASPMPTPTAASNAARAASGGSGSATRRPAAPATATRPPERGSPRPERSEMAPPTRPGHQHGRGHGREQQLAEPASSARRRSAKRGISSSSAYKTRLYSRIVAAADTNAGRQEQGGVAARPAVRRRRGRRRRNRALGAHGGQGGSLARPTMKIARQPKPSEPPPTTGPRAAPRAIAVPNQP